MRMRCWLISVVTALGLLGPARAQSVSLTEAPLVGSCVRNELTLELKGKITVQQDGKQREYPHEARARHVFMERVLEATGAVADKAARFYTAAEGAITFNNQTTRRSLRPERSFLVAQRTKEQVVVYSLKGLLTREEMELTEHFDTLAVAGLLPDKEVKGGATWAVPNAVAAYLCDLDGVHVHDITCKLEEASDTRARVSISGSAEGIGQGALVKLLVAGHYVFDLEARRLVELEWKQTDQRQQGPVSPALSADVVIKLTRTPIPEPTELSKFALEPIEAYKTLPAEHTNIDFRDAKRRYHLKHAREWHVVSPDGNDQLVLRLMDNRGKFVAQATVTPWPGANNANAPTLKDFAELMAKTPGWEEEKVTEQAELPDAPEGQKIYRVTATGELDGVKSVQSFYLLQGAKGEKVIVTFTMLPTLVEALRSRDLEMVRNLNFPSGDGK